MTKELLEQYPDICAEIKRLETPVTDTVTGSMADYPYTRRTWTVQGVYVEISELEELKAMRQGILDFVNSLPLSQKRIVTYRALYSLPWARVAAKMGHRYSEGGVKQIYSRIFKEKS